MRYKMTIELSRRPSYLEYMTIKLSPFHSMRRRTWTVNAGLASRTEAAPVNHLLRVPPDEPGISGLLKTDQVFQR